MVQFIEPGANVHKLLVGMTLAAGAVLFGAYAVAQSSDPAMLQRANARIAVWDIPEIDQLPDNDYGQLIRYGRSVLIATPSHIGPDAADPAMRFAGNNLACANCHLNAGTKKFGLPLVAAYVDYPEYSARGGATSTIEERLDGCMTRSLNGSVLPRDSRPMLALVAYLKLLSTSLPPQAKIEGAGSGGIADLDRAADPVRGAAVYQQKCAYCHGDNGLGVRRNVADASFGYGVPPLWGPDSFNDGAGMNRLTTIASFVHMNMPNGTSWVMPQLTVEESWDVGAYVVAQPRPQRAGFDQDFPNLLLKPADTPYGPYADSFPLAQHKFGPFPPIRAEIARMKAEKGTVPNPNVK